MMDVFQRAGIFLMCGALVNDVLLLDGNAWTAMAKILFALGLILILASGLAVRSITKTDLAVVLYVLGLLCIGAFAARGLASDGWRSISVSLLIGLIGHAVFALSAEKSFSTVAQYYVFWVVISVLVGLVQTFTGNLYFSERIFESTILIGAHRASGFTSDPNYFGLVCLMALPLVAVMTGWSVSIKRLLYAIALIGVVISGSRSTLIVVVLYFLFSLMYGRQMSVTVKAFLVVLVAVAALALYRFMPESILLVFDAGAYGEGAERNSLQDRALAAIAAVKVGLENTVFGYGLGSFRDHPDNIHSQVSHNTYLELFAESGLLGVLAFTSLFFYVLIRCRAQKTMPATQSAHVLFLFLLMSLFLVTHYSRLMFFATGLASAAIFQSSLTRRKHADH